MTTRDSLICATIHIVGCSDAHKAGGSLMMATQSAIWPFDIYTK